MTDGMKPGRGDDPFADDDDDDKDDVEDESPAESPDTTPETRRETGEGWGDRPSEPELPWKYRRDTATSDRPVQKPLFLQEETLDQEEDVLETVEDLLGEDVQLTDFREAAYLVAMTQSDEIANKLQEWGYNY